MPPTETEVLRAQLDRLEQRVRELQERLGEVERKLAASLEHTVDRTAVREKVVYDWQS